MVLLVELVVTTPMVPPAVRVVMTLMAPPVVQVVASAAATTPMALLAAVIPVSQPITRAPNPSGSHTVFFKFTSCS